MRPSTAINRRLGKDLGGCPGSAPAAAGIGIDIAPRPPRTDVSTFDVGVFLVNLTAITAYRPRTRPKRTRLEAASYGVPPAPLSTYAAAK